MGVLVAGQRIRLDRPGTPFIGDVFVSKVEGNGPNIRGFLVVNLSSATVLLRWSGGQPDSSAQFNATVGAFEAVSLPTVGPDNSGARDLWVYSTTATADFVVSLYDHAVSVFLKSNPATVPTAAAVKLEDGAVAGRFAEVSGAGALSVSFDGVAQPITLSAAADVSDRAARLLGIVASIAAALPAGNNNIGDVDVATLPTGAVTDKSATLVANTAADFVAANAARKGLLLYNATGAVVYARYGANATTAAYHFQLVAGQTYEPPPGAVPTDRLSLISVGGGDVKGYEL